MSTYSFPQTKNTSSLPFKCGSVRCNDNYLKYKKNIKDCQHQARFSEINGIVAAIVFRVVIQTGFSDKTNCIRTLTEIVGNSYFPLTKRGVLIMNS